MAETPTCPKCGGTEVQPADVLTRHFNVWFFLLGGWFFSLLCGLARSEKLRCVRCDAIFQHTTRSIVAARILIVVLVLLAVLGFWSKLTQRPP